MGIDAELSRLDRDLKLKVSPILVVFELKISYLTNSRFYAHEVKAGTILRRFPSIESRWQEKLLSWIDTVWGVKNLQNAPVTSCCLEGAFR